MSEYVNCDFCGLDNTKPLFVKNSYNIVKCKNCGLIYVNPRPSSKELEGLYKEDFFSKGSYEKGLYVDYIRERGEPSKNLFITKRIEKLKSLSNGGRLLDVGCAHGFFLKVASQRWGPYGVEISEYASNYAREKMGLNVSTGTLMDTAFPDEYFDVVVMWELIDHLPNPGEILKEASRILKKNGIIGLNIGNTNSFRFMINGENWRTLHPPDHLYYYSLRTIKKMLKKAGFGKFQITGKREVGLFTIIKNPDLDKISGYKKKHHFHFSTLQWIKLILKGIICYLSVVTHIGDYTVGSNMDIYAIKT